MGWMGWTCLRWKFSTISGRSDFRKVSWFSFSFKTQIWPSRFLERCSHFQFLQITNLAVQIFGKVFTFAFLMKIEMWTPFLYRFGQERCSHFDFHQKRKCEHLSKNLDGQICVLKKNENVNTYFCTTCSDLRFEIKWKSGHLSEIWTARNCWEFPPQDVYSVDYQVLIRVFSIFPWISGQNISFASIP